MDPSLHLVVMAGGSGTRFWPKSTARKPKQLLSFSNDPTSTLLTQTLQRFDGLVPGSNRIVVTTESLSAAVLEQAPGVQVLAEPQGRNTAPCIYWAARVVAARDPDAVMLVMPSDHYIAQPEGFRAAVVAASAWAKSHRDLVTLGVKPSRPETGYGYLKLEEKVRAVGCQKVVAFVEKPNLENATRFIESGEYLWNGGMFLWRASVVLEAFDHYMPELKKVWESENGRVTSAYPRMTATSIDYGVMEKARNVVTFPLDCGWDDLGSWTSLESLAEALGTRSKDGVINGGQVISVDSSGNIVDVENKLVALLGVHDLVVAQHGNSILVARKDRAQDIRLIVEQVKKTRPDLA